MNETIDLSLLQDLGRRAKAASRSLRSASGASRNAWLARSAEALRRQTASILEANQADLDTAPERGLTEAAIDRLRLSPERVDAMAAALEEVAGLPDPVGIVTESRKQPNGLDVSKVTVPIGVILIIYESRPNVTADAAALCLKSGNAVILRGGRDAWETNGRIREILARELECCGLPQDAVQAVPSADRAHVGRLLQMPEFIDLVVPRGGENLIRRVSEEARMPVLKHDKGNCHLYIDEHADLEMAARLAVNAKAQRPGVCNAIETLLIHAGVADRLLPELARELEAAGVELRGDERSRSLAPSIAPAGESDWETEYLAKILAVAVVDSIDQAIEHISQYGSEHTEAIVTTDLKAARRFVAEVDSSAVMVNASTRFNDGGQLGLGAEIGISTNRLHARGPCGLQELTTYKWVVYGDGQIRT